MTIEIHTGKELLDSGIKTFHVLNGCWNGEIAIRNNQPHLYCTDSSGELVNSFPIHNSSKLDFTIEPLTYRKVKCGHCGEELRPRDILGEGLNLKDICITNCWKNAFRDKFICPECVKEHDEQLEAFYNKFLNIKED